MVETNNDREVMDRRLKKIEDDLIYEDEYDSLVWGGKDTIKELLRYIKLLKSELRKAREEVIKQFEDNSIKAILPMNRVHVCIREDIFEKLKSGSKKEGVNEDE